MKQQGRRNRTQTRPHRPTIIERPPLLPEHVTPIGEHRQLATSHGWYWIGAACATPEELRSIQGIVIYSQEHYLFLKANEAREVVSTAGFLLERLEEGSGQRKDSHE